MDWRGLLYRQPHKLICSLDVGDPVYIRQTRTGKLRMRERLDDGSYVDLGSVAGKPKYDKKAEGIISLTPA